MRQLQRKQVALAMAGVLFCLSTVSIGKHAGSHKSVPVQVQTTTALGEPPLSRQNEQNPVRRSMLAVVNETRALSTAVLHPIESLLGRVANKVR